MDVCTVGRQQAAHCGTLEVPENPGERGGRRIGIRVALIEAGSRPVRPDPVFFVAGGPGASAITSFGDVTSMFPDLHTHRDFVLVDQRGRRVTPEPPTHAAVQGGPGGLRTASRGSVRRRPALLHHLSSHGHLDAVRRSLGYHSANLYGVSYGATAVQYFLRQHADRVRTAVLDGGSLLDVPLFELIAPNSHRALDDVFRRCAADAGCATAYPDPRAELASVLARLDRAPVTTSGNAPSTEVTRELFANVVHLWLLRAETAAQIPWLIHRTALGDLEPVAQARDQAFPDLQAVVMQAEIRCSEAWARFDPERVRELGAGSYYGPVQLAAAREQASLCPLVPRGVTQDGDARQCGPRCPYCC
jgi:pimeloyl-ACP methyl ester carboxylesterase